MNLKYSAILLCLFTTGIVHGMGLTTKRMCIAGLVEGSKLRRTVSVNPYFCDISSRRLAGTYHPGVCLAAPLHRCTIDLSASGLGSSVTFVVPTPCCTSSRHTVSTTQPT